QRHGQDAGVQGLEHPRRRRRLPVTHRAAMNEPSRVDRRRILSLLGAGAAVGVASRWLDSTSPAAAAARQAAPVTFPRGAVIRTVLKDVPPDSLTTATLFHEHLSFEWAKVAP